MTMQLTHARAFDTTEATLWRGPARAAAPTLAVSEPSSSFGAAQRPNLAAIAAIAALHAAAIAALVLLDVIPVSQPHVQRLTVIDIAEPAPPPLVAPPPPPVVAERPPAPAPTPLVSPPPIVATPAAGASIASVAVAAPVIAAVVPAPAAPPAAAVVAAIVPPNGLAKSLANAAPRYPVESRRRREEGTVRLRVVITPEGRVKEISIARSSGFERLDTAALDAVRDWRFLPGTLAGEAVEAIGFVPIPFKIRV